MIAVSHTTVISGVALVHLIARPALRFLATVPFDTIVDFVFVILFIAFGPVYENYAVASFQAWKFKSGDSLVCGNLILIEVYLFFPLPPLSLSSLLHEIVSRINDGRIIASLSRAVLLKILFTDINLLITMMV